MTLLARRSLLTLLAAPAIVRAASLMPVAMLPYPGVSDPHVWSMVGDDGLPVAGSFIEIVDSSGQTWRLAVLA